MAGGKLILPLPPDLMSLIFAISAAQGSGAPWRLPLLITARFIVGEQLLRAEAPAESTEFSLMYSAISALLGSPIALPGGALLRDVASTRASRMRTSTAADGFRALLRSPLFNTFRWTSGGHSRKSCEARSSTLLFVKNSSTSSSVGGFSSLSDLGILINHTTMKLRFGFYALQTTSRRSNCIARAPHGAGNWQY